MLLYSYDALSNLIHYDCKEHLDNLYRLQSNDNRYDDIIINYINQTMTSKNFFENEDIEKLKDEYLKKINQIANAFKEYEPKIKILIYMELLRLNAMYESVGDRVAIISQTGLNVAVLGKGCCDAQARFLCNLLLVSGFKAKSVRTHENDHNHAVTLVGVENNKCIILDPTIYSGDKKMLEKTTGVYSKFFDDKGIEWTQLIANDEEIKTARCLALDFLKNKFNLKSISAGLYLDELSEEQKIIKIIVFIESILTNRNNLPLKFRSVEINGEEVEVGKKLELMFYTNGIMYEVISIGKTKASSMLLINLFGKKVILSPINMYPMTKNWAAYFDENNSPKLISDNLELQTKFDNELKKIRLESVVPFKRH